MFIVVGFSTGCPACTQMKFRLDMAKLEYRYLDANNPANEAEVNEIDHQYGITGVPFILFPNGQTIVGVAPIDRIKAHIEASN